jgi:hypothetical protein
VLLIDYIERQALVVDPIALLAAMSIVLGGMIGELYPDNMTEFLDRHCDLMREVAAARRAFPAGPAQ